MPRLSRKARSVLLLIMVSVFLAGGILIIYRLVLDRSESGQYENMHGWQAMSGRWTQNAGIFTNANYGRGDMLIAQHSKRSNYSISADIRFDLLFPETHYGDAGLVIRTTDPQPGVDSYEGYYAGLRPDTQTVILGRASYDWHKLAVAKLNSPISVGSWYRLEISAQGCTLTVSVNPVNGQSPTKLQYDDKACMTEGVAGLRSFYAQASWRDVKITPH